MKKIDVFEREVQKIFSEEFTVKRLNILLLALVALLAAALFALLKMDLKYYAYGVIAVDLVAIFVVLRRKKKKNRAKELLNDAIHNIRRNNISESFGELIEAYQVFRNSRLLEFIFILATQYQPDLQQQSVIISLELEKLKAQKQSDKKLLEILKQIVHLTESIDKYKEIIEKSQNKISELEEELSLTEEQEFVDEYLKIIKRYQEIIEKQKRKIEENRQKVERLLKLKNNFIITQKIIKAREELQRLEDELWENSIGDTLLEDTFSLKSQSHKPSLFIKDPVAEHQRNISGEAV